MLRESKSTYCGAHAIEGSAKCKPCGAKEQDPCRLHGVMNDPECCIQGSLPEALSQSWRTSLHCGHAQQQVWAVLPHDIVGTV